MPVIVRELEESRRYHDDEDKRADRDERKYLASGSLIEQEVLSAVKAFVPAAVARPAHRPLRGNLVLANIAIRNEQVNDVFSAIAVWMDPTRVNDKYKLGKIATSYDTGGQRAKIFEGVPEAGWFRDVQHPQAPIKYEKGLVPNTGGGTSVGIDPANEGVPNVLDFKERRGVDVPVGALTFRERHIFEAAAITLPYMCDVAGLVGKTNDAVYRGLQVGEALFLGANARQPNNDNATWEIEFHWLVKKNQVFVKVADDGQGNFITFDFMGGHEYLQVLTRKHLTTFVINYGESNEITLKVPTPQVYAAFMHKIYEDGDFSQLLIGN